MNHEQNVRDYAEQLRIDQMHAAVDAYRAQQETGELAADDELTDDILALFHKQEVRRSVHDAETRLGQAAASGDFTARHRAVRNSIAAKSQLLGMVANASNHTIDPASFADNVRALIEKEQTT